MQHVHRQSAHLVMFSIWGSPARSDQDFVFPLLEDTVESWQEMREEKEMKDDMKQQSLAVGKELKPGMLQLVFNPSAIGCKRAPYH